MQIYKLFEIKNFKFGLDATLWRQPELLVEDPYRSKPKIGGMAILDASYNTGHDINFIIKAGYKTKGFVPGYPIAVGPLISVATEVIL